MFKRFFILAFAFCFIASGNNILRGQETGLESERETESGYLSDDIHDFFDVNEELLVTGKFISLKTSNVKIKEVNGQRVEFKINQFSEKDQAYIKNMARYQRKYEKNKKETNEILKEMSQSEDIAKKIRSCNKIRGLGAAANKAQAAMRGFFTHEDDRLKRASFQAYAAICDLSEVNYRLLTDEMATEKWDMRRAFINRPGDYLESLVRFRDYSIPYLQHAAFTGRLKLKSDEPSVNQEPVLFTEAKSSKNKVRAAACKTFGILKDESGTNIILDLLPVAEKVVSEQRDDATLKAAVKSLGQIGANNDAVVDALNRLKTDFPEEVAKALSQLKDD